MNPEEQRAWLRAAWRRWLTWLALASVFSIACWFLSQWQLSRHDQMNALIQRIDKNYSMPAVPGSQWIKQHPNPALSNEYLALEFKGSYVANSCLLVRNRPRSGQPGFEQICVFRAKSGDLLFVNRGWLATGSSQDSPDDLLLPTSDETTLVGRVKLPESPDMRSAPRGQLMSVNLAQAKKKLAADVAEAKSSFYLLAESESPRAKRTPLYSTKPQISEGNHLSYAMQWVIFAIMAFTAIGWAIRQELIARKSATQPNFVMKKRKRVGEDDEAYEDLLTE